MSSTSGSSDAFRDGSFAASSRNSPGAAAEGDANAETSKQLKAKSFKLRAWSLEQFKNVMFSYLSSIFALKKTFSPGAKTAEAVSPPLKSPLSSDVTASGAAFGLPKASSALAP